MVVHVILNFKCTVQIFSPSFYSYTILYTVNSDPTVTHAIYFAVSEVEL